MGMKCWQLPFSYPQYMMEGDQFSLLPSTVKVITHNMAKLAKEQNLSRIRITMPWWELESLSCQLTVQQSSH